MANRSRSGPPDATRLGAGLVDRDAPPSVRPVALAVLALITLTYASMLLPDDIPGWLIQEEHPIELIGAVGLLVGAIVCIVLWRGVRGDPAWPPLRRLSLLGFGLLMFFGAGEEESWGQRLLGIKTPTSLSEINAQHELNVHNLNAFNGINSDTLFGLLWLVMGVMVPVLALWPAPRRLFEKALPILPVTLSGLFVYNQLLFWGFGYLFHHNPDLFHSSYPYGYSLVEIKETFGELLLGVGFLFILLNRRAARRTAETPSTASPR